MSWMRSWGKLRFCTDKWQSSASRKILSRVIMPTPNSNDGRHGGQIVAKMLKANQVQNIFCLSGGHVSPIFTGCEEEGIKVVDTRNEANAVFAADAAARLTGNIGVAVVTAGPGVTNTVTAMKNAQMAGSPLLLLGGAAATLLKGRGALQDIEQRDILNSVCKDTFTVNTVRDIVPTLRKAIAAAKEGVPGPVFVELPIDTLYPYAVTASEIIGEQTGKPSLQKRIVDFYMGAHLHNLFTKAFENEDYDVTVDSLPVKSDEVKSVHDMLKLAKKPVILLQSQATLQPRKLANFAAGLEKLGVPVFLGGMARGLLGSESTVQCRHTRGVALKNADLIILCGVSADFRLNYGRSLPRTAKIITVNRDVAELNKNTDMFWKPTVKVNSDPCDFMLEVLDNDVDSAHWAEWLQDCKKRDQTRDAEIAKMAESPAGGKINPLKLFLELDDMLPANSILVADGGDFVGTASYILRPRSPLSWLDPGAYGTLGVGGGFAIGAAAVDSSRPIFIIYGDGSAGYSIVEMDTAKRFGFNNINAVIGNDGKWNQILRAQQQILGSPVANILATSRYDLIAEAFDGKGFLLNNPENDSTIFQKCFNDALAEQNPTVINAMLGSTEFRDGSISV